jgi:hypothetical protein
MMANLSNGTVPLLCTDIAWRTPLWERDRVAMVLGIGRFRGWLRPTLASGHPTSPL